MNRAIGTSASPVASQNGDNVGAIAFVSYDGLSNQYSALINSVVNGTVSTEGVPQDLYFSTGTNSSRPERMRITSTDNVGIGTAASVAKLDISGYGNKDNRRFSGSRQSINL